MELTQEQKLLQTIITKSWEDNIFKKELIANPVKAIENLTGKRIKIPENKTMTVVDQSDTSIIYLNIPAEPNMEDIELTEEQLEIIAGGGDPGAVFQGTMGNQNPLDGIIE